MRSEVLDWLEEAKADLRHAEASIQVGDYNWACFAAQQAAEKALKALILHALGELPRSHDLVRLYWKAREAVDLGLSEASQASEAVEVARQVVAKVSEAIRDP